MSHKCDFPETRNKHRPYHHWRVRVKRFQPLCLVRLIALGCQRKDAQFHFGTRITRMSLFGLEQGMNLTGEPATGEIRADAAPETKYVILQTLMFLLFKRKAKFSLGDTLPHL